MVYLVPLLCFVVALIVGALALRAGRGWIAALLALFLAAVMIWAIWTGRQHQGWDAIGYGILAMLMMAPAILGLGAGALIGWRQRRRRAREG